MKQKLICVFILFACHSAFGQVSQEELQKEIKPLTEKLKLFESERNKMKSKIEEFQSKLLNANESIDSLRNQTQNNSAAINETSIELGLKISTTETNLNQKITAVDNSLRKSSLY